VRCRGLAHPAGRGKVADVKLSCGAQRDEQSNAARITQEPERVRETINGVVVRQ
jgi:hypothetical protein